MSSPGTQGMSLASTHIHYELSGVDGPRVVLLHPIGFDRYSWKLVSPYLEDRCRLLSLDLPGHGESDKPADGDYTLPSLAARVLQILDELGWSTAAFVGNSLGGGVALAAALAAPNRVRSLTLMNTVAYRDKLAKVGWLGFVGPIRALTGRTPSAAIGWGLGIARCGRGSVTKNLCDRCSHYLRSPAGRHAFYRTLQQLYGPTLDTMSRQYSEIVQPTLLIHGLNDPLISLESTRRLLSVLPNATLRVLPHCGHFPQEESPDRVGPMLREFIAG